MSCGAHSVPHPVTLNLQFPADLGETAAAMATIQVSVKRCRYKKHKAAPGLMTCSMYSERSRVRINKMIKLSYIVVIVMFKLIAPEAAPNSTTKMHTEKPISIAITETHHHTN
jgi:hypothetical protein